MSLKRSLWGHYGTVAVLAATVFVVAGAVQAAPITCTIADHFMSEDLGGQIKEGHYSESYVGGGARQAGNVISAASWSDPDLGLQWIVSGPVVDSVVDKGLDPITGLHLYEVEYDISGVSGVDVEMALKNGGPWWNPADAPLTQYDVTITEYRHDVSVDPLGYATTYITLYGTIPAFPGYAVEIFWATAAQEGEGQHPGAAYPAYLPESWQGDDGQWGLVQQITVVLTPEPATLGLLAVGGMVALMRRRRGAAA